MPHTAGIMDAISDPAVHEVWCQKSKQMAWTEILLNTIGYFSDADPAPQMLMQPTLEAAESFSKERLAPMVRDSPTLRERYPEPKARHAGNTLRHKQYPGGYITLQGANTPTGLAMRPLRVLLCDEVDKYPLKAGTSGDPISLARDRLQTFWNRKMLAGSTPTIKGRSRVEAGFMTSDQRYAYYACPECGERQRLVWAQVKWTEIGLPARKAKYQCVHCGALLTEGQRRKMLQDPEWRATRPFDGIAGFHMNELMSPFSSLGEMAAAFEEAKKLPETLQSFINERLGETWEDTASSVEPTGLKSRAEPYGPELLPAGIVLLTLGVDTQDDRLELELVGWGREEESWITQHLVLRGDPGVSPTRGVWADLTAFRRKAFKTEDGRTLRIQATGIDFQGHFSQQVANYAYKYRFERVFAVRGVGGAGKLIWPRRPGKTKLSKADIYNVGVDTAKDVLYGRLAKVTVPGPGYIHLTASVDDEFCEQLVAESKVYSTRGMRRVAKWEPKKPGARNEAQDCWIYAYAVMFAATRGRGFTLEQLANLVEAKRGKVEQQTPPPVIAESVVTEDGEVLPKESAAPAEKVQTSAPEQPPPDPSPPPRPKPRRPRFRVGRSNYMRK